MSQTLPDNYVEEVPEDVDMSQEAWEELGYHGQYHHAGLDQEAKKRGRHKRQKKKQSWLDRIKAEKGCVNCGLDNPTCLDYHHTESKEFQLGGAGYRDVGTERLKKELNKCVVICSNCHRRLHAEEITV